MPFPRELLAEHEELVLDLRPHWVALIAPIGVAVGVAVGWYFIFKVTPSGSVGEVLNWIAIGVGLIVMILYSVRQIVDWATDNFVVTTDRLIRRRGLIAKSSMEIPLEAINDVRFRQGIIGRMIGAGSLVIQSASEQGREEFANIRHPARVQKTIYEQGERNQQRMFAGGTKHVATGADANAGVGSVADEIRKLDLLRADGLISDQEFAERKSKLLGS